MADVNWHRRASMAALLGVPVGALLVANVVVGNWWSAAALLATVISLTIAWREARRRDQEHRAAFEQRLEHARRKAVGDFENGT
jgi:hypothetical protein